MNDIIHYMGDYMLSTLQVFARSCQIYRFIGNVDCDSCFKFSRKISKHLASYNKELALVDERLDVKLPPPMSKMMFLVED